MAASFQGFQSLIENSPDAIFLIDTVGEILYGSASTTKIFGYQPVELVGRNCLELIHAEDRAYFANAEQLEIGPANERARGAVGAIQRSSRRPGPEGDRRRGASPD
jgi:PAS domain S-box-containing protein